MGQLLIVPYELPGLNELLSAAGRSYRRGRGGRRQSGYNALKARCEGDLLGLIRSQGLHPVGQEEYPIWIGFRWVCGDRRRDPDNIRGGGCKILLDALVKAGILEGDGWRHIAGFRDRFEINAVYPRYEVELGGLGFGRDCFDFDIGSVYSCYERQKEGGFV